jgi:hypothetical protein
MLKITHIVRNFFCMNLGSKKVLHYFQVWEENSQIFYFKIVSSILHCIRFKADKLIFKTIYIMKTTNNVNCRGVVMVVIKFQLFTLSLPACAKLLVEMDDQLKIVSFVPKQFCVSFKFLLAWNYFWFCICFKLIYKL